MVEDKEVKLKMIPTNGKRPSGIEGKMIWLQDKDGDMSCSKCIDANWNFYIAYCFAQEIPEPYEPEPCEIDYFKYIGKLCKFYLNEGDLKIDRFYDVGILKRIDLCDDGETLFIADGMPWGLPYCKPISVINDSEIIYKE